MRAEQEVLQSFHVGKAHVLPEVSQNGKAKNWKGVNIHQLGTQQGIIPVECTTVKKVSSHSFSNTQIALQESPSVK